MDGDARGCFGEVGGEGCAGAEGGGGRWDLRVGLDGRRRTTALLAIRRALLVDDAGRSVRTPQATARLLFTFRYSSLGLLCEQGEPFVTALASPFSVRG